MEATAYPGVAAEVPESAREFLETESATAFEGRDTNARQDPHVTPEACLGVGGALDGVIERLVVYPARNGHASYHMPKRCVRVSWCWKALLRMFCGRHKIWTMDGVQPHGVRVIHKSAADTGAPWARLIDNCTPGLQL